MRNLTNSIHAPFTTSQEKSLAFSKAMVIFLAISLTFSFIFFANRINPQWNGFYLILLTLIVSVECLATRKRLEELEGQNRWVFHLSEWIAFAVLIKLILYLVHTPTQILSDIPRWQTDFFGSFFTGEYLFSLVIAAFVWLTSKAYFDDLDELIIHENDAAWDELGRLQNNLQNVRSRITSRVFIVGILVVILTTFYRIDLSGYLDLPDTLRYRMDIPLVNLVAYFVLALLFLSQTQLTVLRTRWLWQRLPIHGKLTENWIRYSIFFLVLIFCISLFLPTHYSIGLLQTLQVAIGLVISFFGILLSLVLLPVTLCFSLFSISSGGQNPGQPLSLPPTISAAPSSPTAWLEFLKSLFFWVIFLAVIFFAVRYYLSQNSQLLQSVAQFPLIRWLTAAWQAFFRWIKRGQHQVADFVGTTFQKIRAQRLSGVSSRVSRFFDPSRLSPRERIIRLYADMIHFNQEHGIPHPPSQTPAQYEENVIQTIPETSVEIHRITDDFVEARYSQHLIDEPRSSRTMLAWKMIKEKITALRRE